MTTNELTSEEREAATVLGMARPRRPVLRTTAIRSLARRAGSPLRVKVIETLTYADGRTVESEVIRLRVRPALESGTATGTRRGWDSVPKSAPIPGRVGRGCISLPAASCVA